MNICVVPRPPSGGLNKLPECDLAILGFPCLAAIDFESELSGRTDKLGAFSRLTRNGPAAIAGCITDSRGLRRRSAVVAEGGRLLGITDMLHVVDGENLKSGAYLGLYRLSGYKVGLCIENDMHFPEDIKSLSLCGCNLLVLLRENSDCMSPLLARAYAYLFGMPAVLCASNCAYFADITGSIVTSTSPVTLFSAQPRNAYHVVTTRRRGLASEECTDY